MPTKCFITLTLLIIRKAIKAKKLVINVIYKMKLNKRYHQKNWKFFNQKLLNYMQTYDQSIGKPFYLKIIKNQLPQGVI